MTNGKISMFWPIVTEEAMIKDKMMTGLKNESKKMTVLENDYKTDDVLIAGAAELLAREAEVEGVGVVEAGRQHCCHHCRWRGFRILVVNNLEVISMDVINTIVIIVIFPFTQD